MSEDAEEKGIDSKKKFSLSSLQVDRKFLVVAAFLLLSIVAVVFATQDLFETSIDDWTVTQGRFEGKDGSMYATMQSFNWAYHESEVAYGTWEWQFKYGIQGSASVIFIGLEQDPDTFSHATNGYKIEFDITKSLSLKRIDGLANEAPIGSANVEIESGSIYKISVNRFTNNTFRVFLNDAFIITAVDDTYTESEVFELDWVFPHTLNWVDVKGEIAKSSWSDYFVGMPQSSSANIFTQIALYAPFVALGLVILFYAFRLLLSDGSWTRFIIPLILAIIIGVGAGLLFDYLRDVLSDSNPITSGTPGTVTIDNTTSYDNSNSYSSNNGTTSGNGGGGGGILPPFEKKPISIILLVVSSVFILAAISFVVVDFFRKRDDEFHEQVLDKDVRWMPKAEDSDHRKRVIRAYHKASYDLIDHGAKSERSMTPGEFEQAAIENLDVPEEPLEEITDLYESARFSDQDIDSTMSNKAEKYYEKISQNLKESAKEGVKKETKTSSKEKDEEQATEEE